MPNNTHLWLESEERTVRVKCDCIATNLIGAMFVGGFGTENDKISFNNRQKCPDCHGTGFVEKRVKVRCEVTMWAEFGGGEGDEDLFTGYDGSILMPDGTWDTFGICEESIGQVGDAIVDDILSRYADGDESVKQFVEEVEDEG